MAGRIARALRRLLLSAPMRKLLDQRALTAWLILSVIVLGGGLIETHSHEWLTKGNLGSIAASDGQGLPGTTECVEASTSIEVDPCPACMAGQRQGVLDASDSTPRSRWVVSKRVRPADSFIR